MTACLIIAAAAKEFAEEISRTADCPIPVKACTSAEEALDVFDEEPIPRKSPLWNTPGLSITAHIAAISHPSLIVPIFVENYRRYCDKQPLKYVVDFDRGY